jgi:hypothetical protein
LSAPTDARVVAARHAHETYSETVERVLRAVRPWQMVQEPLPTAVVALLAGLRPERTAMAVVYRSLCWTRQTLEQVVQTYRAELARLGVRLHVATKDVAGGRKEGYITIDGMRYSAISVDEA